MQNINFEKNFNEAVNIVSPKLRGILEKLPGDVKRDTQEIRLRANRPIILFGKFSSLFLKLDGSTSNVVDDELYICTSSTLNDTFNRLCCYSIHTHQNSIINGYITMQGGHRAGVVGTAVCTNSNEISSIKDISSINIRIAREVFGSADEIIERVFKKDAPSIIIAGAPSSGKTTMLRDLIRQLSSGNFCLKVSVIDEREELSAMNSGIAQNDLGICSDILVSYPKDLAIVTAIRTMSPQIIACDEVGTMQEIKAIELGVNTGVRFITTVHASNYDELLQRPQIHRLLNTYSFDKVVLLKNGTTPCQIEDIFDVRELRDEIYRRKSFVDCSNIDWYDECIEA